MRSMRVLRPEIQRSAPGLAAAARTSATLMPHVTRKPHPNLLSIYLDAVSIVLDLEQLDATVLDLHAESLTGALPCQLAKRKVAML